MLSKGRAVLGVGAGDSAVRTAGLSPARLPQIREHMEFMRALLDGAEVPGLRSDEEAAKKTLSEVAVPAVPADAVSLSLADVRSAVLANNLDLRTALVDPAIARGLLAAVVVKPGRDGLLGARSLALQARRHGLPVIVGHLWDGPRGLLSACRKPG
jgi:alkanesulfonate monooxygenase SsuD/methylene tetrahydromethanopterin reductase-like flavin-dependent oxidoreductase (luciferase family)